MNQPTINNLFIAWAKSFSGFDGGNPKGAIWFCGIEYGGSKIPEFVPQEIPRDISNEEERKRFLKYQYDRKIIKLYSSILGKRVIDYKKVFQETGAFKKESDLFKMNLYPIAFKNDWKGHWSKDLFDKTGLISKTHYQAWCQINRFPMLKFWSETYQPKIIIGTGSTYSLEYTMAFCGIENSFQKPNSEEIDGKQLLWSNTSNSKTLLFVIPFLGPGGLMKDDHIKSFGNRIASISKDYHGAAWCKTYDKLK